MRCPKCGFISFDQQPSCTKCNADLTATAPNLMGTGQRTTAPFFLGAILNEGTGTAPMVEEPAEVTTEAAAPEAPEAKEGTAALFEALEAESQDLGQPEETPAEAGEELDLSLSEPVAEAEAEEELSIDFQEEEVSPEPPALELSDEEPTAPPEETAPPQEEELELAVELEEEPAQEEPQLAEAEPELTLETPEEEPTEPDLDVSGDEAAPSFTLEEIDLSDLVEKKGSTAQSIGSSNDSDDDIFDLSALMGGTDDDEETHRGDAEGQGVEELILELDHEDDTAAAADQPAEKTKPPANVSGLTLEDNDQ